MKGDSIRKLQQMLGFSFGDQDGDFGPRTKTALINFQLAHGLTADGVVGKRTLDALEKAAFPEVPGTQYIPSPTLEQVRNGTAPLQYGMQGDAVKALQKQLGFNADAQTGRFDVRTREAVLDFQKAAGLWPNGARPNVVDKATADVLFKGPPEPTWDVAPSIEDVRSGTAPLIRQGMAGDGVRELQKLLGFDTLDRDGHFDAKTTQALAAFQQAHGLARPAGLEGTLDAATLKALDDAYVPQADQASSRAVASDPQSGRTQGTGPAVLDASSAQAQSAVEASLAFLQGRNARVAGSTDSFAARVVERDALGMMHVRMDRTHQGLKVYGEDVVTHLDKDGQVSSVTGSRNEAALPNVDFTKLITPEKALAAAIKDFGVTPEEGSKPELILFKDEQGTYHPAYAMRLNSLEGTSGRSTEYFVDAENEQVLQREEWVAQEGFQQAKTPETAPADTSVQGTRQSGAQAASTDPINVKGSVTAALAIGDRQTVTSRLKLDSNVKLDQLQLDLDLVHSFRGDLVVQLTSPSGKTATVFNRQGGSQDNLTGPLDLSQAFAGETTAGTWTLTVMDKNDGDTGTLKNWGLSAHGIPTEDPKPTSGDDTSSFYGKVDLGATQQADGTWLLADAERHIQTYDAQHSDYRHVTGAPVVDNNNIWGEVTDSVDNQAAVDAHYAAEMTYDFYKSLFGRDSLDGQGQALNSYVHAGNKLANAFWNGSKMIFGDGDGKTLGPLTGLDVVGHEFTHGFTQSTAKLRYTGESACLNEGFSDVFGKGVEWFAAQKNPNVHFSWSMGMESALNGKPIRRLDDPLAAGTSTDNYNAIRNVPSPEAHFGAGIIGNAFYLMVEGGKNRTSGMQVSNAMGMEKALQIMYRAETYYLTSSANFSDARQACLQAARDLYGAASQEAKTVAEAWSAVGVQ